MTAPGRIAAAPDAILFDFDGVLIDSEYSGNVHLAQWLTDAGHPIDVEQSMKSFMGYSRDAFLSRIAAFIGGPVPDAFHAARLAENERVMRDGIDAVAGAVDFVRSLPADLPIAVASSSTTQWIRRHLDHIGLAERFGDHLYSGAEHVSRGKPAPDLYLFAAAQLGVPIDRCAILEDSEVGATGAVASGAYVVGLCAGMACPPGQADRLKTIGVDAVAADFDQVRRLLALS